MVTIPLWLAWWLFGMNVAGLMLILSCLALQVYPINQKLTAAGGVFRVVWFATFAVMWWAAAQGWWA